MAPRPAQPSAASGRQFPSPGTLVDDKYRVEEVLGAGGMGVVVAATHVGLKQRFAIKFLVHGLHDPDVVERFKREARAASELKSEHVARVFDVAELPSGQPYMVMEYLDGYDLERWLSEHGPLPIHDAVGYLLQACEAVAEAHSRGIIHRDLKPGNLFLTKRPDGTPQVKVVDFGVSKVEPRIDEEPGFQVTDGCALLGSPYYMSPEQLRGVSPVDARSDIWSVGISLYELLTGQRPFYAKAIPELTLRIVSDPYVPAHELRPEIPQALEAVLRTCLSKDPEQRYPNVAELARALSPFAGSDARIAARRAVRISRQSRHDQDARPSPASADGAAAPVAPHASVLAELPSDTVDLAVARRSEDSQPDPAPPRAPSRRSLFGVLVVSALAIPAVLVGIRVAAMGSFATPSESVDSPPPSAPARLSAPTVAASSAPGAIDPAPIVADAAVAPPRATAMVSPRPSNPPSTPARPTAAAQYPSAPAAAAVGSVDPLKGRH